MFVYSVKASTLKFAGALVLSLTVLLLLIFLVPTYKGEAVSEAQASETVNYSNIKTAEDRIAFLLQFGWQANKTPVTEEDVTIPSQFDAVFAGYNDLQKQQGLDLAKYKRKAVKHYKYEITNYEGYDGTVFANILVYRGKVIGGDICSADINGFVHGFEKE